MSSRLPPVLGEWIDRSRPLAFEFEGRRYSGFAGDTISSALWAAGVHVLGRSFKYHRPRGVLSLADQDVNALVDDRSAFNVRADVTPLTEGAQLVAVNTFGGLDSDRAHLLDRLSAFLPVGFYYKTFHRPKWMFPHWERLIRSLSGLGRPDLAAPRIRTPKRCDFCDVLVVGAGPAGISAALASARGGANVILLDECARIGGSLTYARGGNRQSSPKLLGELQAQLDATPAISVRAGTVACGLYADRWVALVDAEKMTKVRARSIVVATGAFEQPAVFRNNDLPGIMLASAAQRLIYRYAVAPMRQALILTANLEGYEAALDLLGAGVKIAAVVDLRVASDESSSARQVRERGIPVLNGCCIYEAMPSAGRNGVAGASVCGLDTDGRPDLSRRQHFDCDGIAMSVGFAPAGVFLLQAGGRMRFDESLQQFVPDALPGGMVAAGRVNGVYGLEAKLEDGERAANEALAHIDLAAPGTPRIARETRCPSHSYPVVRHPDGKNFVDFDEDLQLDDFANAVQEGFDSIELLKRYTTVGMGPSQGKHSNMTAVRILARLRGEGPGDIGMPTARPFFHPVPLSHLAGRGFTPERRTPLHSRHERLGAKFMPAGVWQRPEFYRREAKHKDQLVVEEALAVRRDVGLIDVGTLGKIEVAGPDAGELLERVYTGRFENLRVGMTRYAVMLDESGVVVDDGVVARLSDDRFYFTTTTTGSATVYRELQRLIALWRLDCGIVNLTGAMAAMNLAGPRSHEVLQPLTSLLLDEGAFPYLGVREAAIADVPCRVLRVGFVGELGYEIHTPADSAARVWDALMCDGTACGIRAFGVEAQRLLRLEKGHIIVGQDTDGLTTPFQAALGWAVKMDKPFFMGQRSLRIVGKRPLKQKLVGFALDPGLRGPVPKESHLVIRDGEIAGRVTSVAHSPVLGKVIGLALVAPDLSSPGTSVSVRADGGVLVPAKVVPLPFYDPAGERQKFAASRADGEAVPA